MTLELHTDGTVIFQEQVVGKLDRVPFALEEVIVQKRCVFFDATDDEYLSEFLTDFDCTFAYADEQSLLPDGERTTFWAEDAIEGFLEMQWLRERCAAICPIDPRNKPQGGPRMDKKLMRDGIAQAIAGLQLMAEALDGDAPAKTEKPKAANAPAKKAAPETEDAPDTEVTSDDEDEGVTEAQLKEVLKNVAQAFGAPRMQEIVKSVCPDAANIKHVPEDKYGDVVAAANAVLEEKEAA